jgi:hypothetical protein
MDQLPALDRLSGPEKDMLIQVPWAEAQALKARIAQLEAHLQVPKKGSHDSSVPPSKTPKASRGQAWQRPPCDQPGPGWRRTTRAPRSGSDGDRPGQSVSLLWSEVAADAQKRHVLYDKIEIPPVFRWSPGGDNTAASALSVVGLMSPQCR